MTRIEQNPDGTYGKRMTEVEQKTLRLVYKEQDDRAAGDQNLQVQVDALKAQLLTANNDISNLKTKLNQLQATQTTDEDAFQLLQTQFQQLQTLLQQNNVI